MPERLAGPAPALHGCIVQMKSFIRRLSKALQQLSDLMIFLIEPKKYKKCRLQYLDAMLQQLFQPLQRLQQPKKQLHDLLQPLQRYKKRLHEPLQPLQWHKKRLHQSMKPLQPLKKRLHEPGKRSQLVPKQAQLYKKQEIIKLWGYLHAARHRLMPVIPAATGPRRGAVSHALRARGYAQSGSTPVAGSPSQRVARGAMRPDSAVTMRLNHEWTRIHAEKRGMGASPRGDLPALQLTGHDAAKIRAHSCPFVVFHRMNTAQPSLGGWLPQPQRAGGVARPGLPENSRSRESR